MNHPKSHDVSSLRRLPTVFWPRASRWRKWRDGASFYKIRANIAHGIHAKNVNKHGVPVFKICFPQQTHKTFDLSKHISVKKTNLPLNDGNERITRHVGVSFKRSNFLDRHSSNSDEEKPSKLPHLFAVLGVVCEANSNNKEKKIRKPPFLEKVRTSHQWKKHHIKCKSMKIWIWICHSSNESFFLTYAAHHEPIALLEF